MNRPLERPACGPADRSGRLHLCFRRFLLGLATAAGLAGCAISPGPEVAEAGMCNIPRSYLEVEAHDGDTRPAAGTASFAIGFALSTAALHGLGLLLGRALGGAGVLPRLLGGATALGGLVLMVG